MATWFRCYSDIADNYKLKMLAYEDRWHYIALLSCKSLGMLDGKRPEFVFRTVAMRLGLTVGELEEVARRLAEYNLIEQKTLQIVGWNERQFVSDNSKERTRKYRINKKTRDVTATSLQRHCDVPDTDTETDTEKEKTHTRNASKFDPVSYLIQLGVDKQVVMDWMAIRKVKKLPATKTALEAIVNEVKKTGWEMKDAIRFCCEKGWAGFKATWVKDDPPPGEDDFMARMGF